MDRGIRLSPKHGVNPSVAQCFYCGEAKNEVLLFGRVRTPEDADAEAPRLACVDHEPCEKCAQWMKEGVILVSVRDGESGDNPHRTGGFAVVREEAVRRILTPEVAEAVCKHRFAFVPDSAWTVLGLRDTGRAHAE